MNKTMKEIEVRELVRGFNYDKLETMSSDLDMRPYYQRDYVYSEKDAREVIDSIMTGIYIRDMIFVEESSNKKHKYELLDGQQRTTSLGLYVDDKFPWNGKLFSGLSEEEQEVLLSYKIPVCIISDMTKEEKIKWFERTNLFVGKVLTTQEIINAKFHGPFVDSAKKYFMSDRVKKSPNIDRLMEVTDTNIRRGKILEAVLKWAADVEGKKYEEYMGAHQSDPDATDLIYYFNDVLKWAGDLFDGNYKAMKKVEWGVLYNKYGKEPADKVAINSKVELCLADPDVENLPGVFYYVFNGEEKYLSLRTFSESDRTKAYLRQGKKCPLCNQEIADPSTLEAHHIKPWGYGGRTKFDNCVMLCKLCHNKYHAGFYSQPDWFAKAKDPE